MKSINKYCNERIDEGLNLYLKIAQFLAPYVIPLMQKEDEMSRNALTKITFKMAHPMKSFDSPEFKEYEKKSLEVLKKMPTNTDAWKLIDKSNDSNWKDSLKGLSNSKEEGMKVLQKLKEIKV